MTENLDPPVRCAMQNHSRGKRSAQCAAKTAAKTGAKVTTDAKVMAGAAAMLAAVMAGGPARVAWAEERMAREEMTQATLSQETANVRQTALLVLPFGFFDTSGEHRDQTSEHARRLAAMVGDLGTRLSATGLYRVLPAASPASACPAGDTACILAGARAAGAALVLTGTVQKISTMASEVWIGAFDAADGRRVFYRQLSFRGDTDEAWRHATSFLFHQIEADPPTVP